MTKSIVMSEVMEATQIERVTFAYRVIRPSSTPGAHRQVIIRKHVRSDDSAPRSESDPEAKRWVPLKTQDTSRCNVLKNDLTAGCISIFGKGMTQRP